MKYLLAEANRGMRVEYTLDVISRFDTYEKADEAADDHFQTIYNGPPAVSEIHPRSDTHEAVYRYAIMKGDDFFQAATHHAHASFIANQSSALEVVFCDEPIDPHARTIPDWDIVWTDYRGIGGTVADRIEDAEYSTAELLVHLDDIKGVGEKTRQRVINEEALYDWSEIVDAETAVALHRACRTIDSIDEVIEKADDLFPDEHRDKIIEYLEIERML